MKDIAIIGAGGFGREVKMLLDQINLVNPQFNFLGYYDDGISPGTLVNNYPVLGGIEAINTVNQPLGIVAAIGLPSLKKKLLAKINNPQINYPTLIHPNVIIGVDDVNIGEGTIICAGGLITVNIKIGAHVIFNLCCTVGHDTVIGDYCSFMPSVNVSGEVVIEEEVYVGTGAKIINQLTIGTKTIVGAGAVVYKSLPANCTAVGIPAKAVKFND
ncbi:NeuD/PglB/VioB family sugar acetyltransferase [Pedobacter frigiditerrae]|uniref:NeuD/PglB/VioB family sugar acetyltransferase n=1 Tax=Pedobacter frigiditerrae TaxID=2530452 RepID=UPI00292F1C05|nr:NeuD/PglB/VioB family sugar acetyltransferase [Pedobacter frigiditerrae]